jgi:hypothetical protein
MMATLVSFLIIQIPAFTYDPHDTVRGRARARAWEEESRARALTRRRRMWMRPRRRSPSRWWASS